MGICDGLFFAGVVEPMSRVQLLRQQTFDTAQTITGPEALLPFRRRLGDQLQPAAPAAHREKPPVEEHHVPRALVFPAVVLWTSHSSGDPLPELYSPLPPLQAERNLRLF